MSNLIPKHVVIFPDGDRRWAKERGLASVDGYKVAVKRMVSIIKVANKLGIDVITFWGFSTENWKRDKTEVDYLLFNIFIKYGEKLKDDFLKQGIIFKHIGRKDRLPKELYELLSKMEENTKNNTGKTVCVAIDYGGRDEIVRAIKKIISEGIKEEDINEEMFSKYLDTSNLPEPDMIIRTSGEQRMSGFMSWQSAYSELFFVPDYFPDFTDERFIEVINEFSTRKRRFGS